MTDAEIVTICVAGPILYLLIGALVMGVCERHWPGPVGGSLFTLPPLILVWPLVALVMGCLRLWEIAAGRGARI